MPLFNYLGITNLYFSKEKTKNVQFFTNCNVFMDVLNLVAQDIYFCLSDGPNERKVKMIKHQLRAFSTFFKQLVKNN